MNVPRIATLLTCHNRRDKTLACLRALRAQVSPTFEFVFSLPVAHAIQNHKSTALLEVFLVDDASTDGTASAVRELWPEATVIAGNGNLFWCGGMRVAWKEAAKTDPDYYLLLNDDTTITEDAVSELLSLAPSAGSPGIAVAPIADPATGSVVCGGHLGHAPRPVVPRGVHAFCDTMNANCTLVPRSVFKIIGMFHHVYTHAMGDFDYGFLASRNGIPIIQAAKVLGTSKPNPSAHTWLDRQLPRRERFRLLWKNPKGLPFFEWATYCRRNVGWIWPYRAISPALRILLGR